MKIKILIVDDHPFTRAGVRSILEPADTIEIAGEANDGLEAIQQVKDHQPDIVVMDITMPNLSGIDATREILEHQPETKIIALSIHAGEQFVKGMLDAGAVAYLLKEEAPEELLIAIDKVNSGEMYLSSAVTRTALLKDEREKEYAGFNILKTKLLRPPILSTSISRDSIIEELERNVGHPLTLVSAGAGYGKSVTVSQWLEKSKYAHVWISLDEEHNDFRTFLLYLVEGVEMRIPGFLKETGMAIMGIELPPLNQLLHILFNELCDIDQDLILVLDNYHIIKDKKIDQLLNEWLRFPPPNVHLCIITRRDPALKTKSLQSSGRMTEIRMDALSFTNEEIVKLFKQLSGIELDDHASQMLLEKTEGWIIPLRLASMVMKGLEDVDQVLLAFEGELNTLSDYLIEEVLSEIPVDIKNQLLTSSIPDRFCSELIKDISLTEEGKGRPERGGIEFLQWLITANMFVIALDVEGKWFRYNNLFRVLLNIQLESHLGKDKTDQLHQKASLWFEKHEFLEEAMHHAVIIEDFDMAAQIVKKHRLPLLHQNKGLVLEKLLSSLP
ncbi:MAG: response regulator, partial [Cyclobacteriaceae bacterium]|nr:response regulator [Cyclobacteriaceae bacterium]